MSSTTFTFAASSILALTHAIPLQSIPAVPNTLVARGAYTVYGGDGSMAAGWPKQSEWMPFDEAWYV
jgi:hypothetical protein